MQVPRDFLRQRGIRFPGEHRNRQSIGLIIFLHGLKL
jgi:hypothetical protein